jgi:hypothetical protein
MGADYSFLMALLAGSSAALLSIAGLGKGGSDKRRFEELNKKKSVPLFG